MNSTDSSELSEELTEFLLVKISELAKRGARTLESTSHDKALTVGDEGERHGIPSECLAAVQTQSAAISSAATSAVWGSNCGRRVSDESHG